MKEHSRHHKHHEHDNSLSGLLDRCAHYISHRIGTGKRGQDSILAVLSQQPGMTQKELGEHLGIRPASVSELLMKLERKGLVLREKDEQDRRSIQVRLTEAGLASLAQPEDAPSDPFQALSGEEQAQLQALLTKLLADWEQRYGPEPRRHHHKHHHEKENHHGKHE